MNDFFKTTYLRDVKVKKIRDLSYFSFGNNTIAIACDSSGSVGDRPKDRFRQKRDRAGKLLLEVPLKEMICCGLEPMAIYLDLCYPDDDYNREFVEGAKEVINKSGFNENILYVTYGNYNKEPDFSSYGVTIISKVAKGKIRTGRSESGDLVYVVALPMDKDYYEKHLRIETLKKILSLPYVHEALPGGSHGVGYEANELAKTVGLEFEEGNNELINSNRTHSCGAACCCLVTIDPNHRKEFESLDIPNAINYYGVLKGSKKADESYSNLGSETEYTLDEKGIIHFMDGYEINSECTISYGVGIKEEDDTKVESIEDFGTQIIFDTVGKLKGSNLLMIVNNLDFGMKQGGKEIVLKTREKLSTIYPGIVLDAQFSGSTEDNWVADITGFAVRAFGIRRKQ